MPYKTFNNWLFDGLPDSPIPKEQLDKKGKVIVEDILKYNSPISHTFILKLFSKNLPLNYFLNMYCNDINIRYLSKKEFFIFIKKCVKDFKIKRNSLTFYSRQSKNILFDKLREKLPLLKKDDILLLCEKIDQDENSDIIYTSLGIEKIKPKKIKKKIKKKEIKKLSYSVFLRDNFVFETINI